LPAAAFAFAVGIGVIITFHMTTYDIFEGEVGKDPLWVACADGMQNAKATMERIATERPGRYFVWESYSKQVLAVTDTTKKRSAGE
jgi:hypothetical protein